MSTSPAPPATMDSVFALGNQVSNARAELLVGQGNILNNNGINTSAILRDANGNVLANIQETNRTSERIGSQANTIAWNEAAMQEAGFTSVRAQNERINDAQSAFSDRAAKFNSHMLSDSFARLSAQGENGFARSLQATTDGFRHSSSDAAINYANLSAQNFGTKETVAAYGNRMADQTASVLHSITNQHADQTRDLVGVAKDLSTQAALYAGANQLEIAKNTAATQLQAAVNAKDAALQAAINSKESVLQASFLAKEGLLENSKWFALAEKTAMVNKCELEAKMAACCCEIKEAVIVSSNSTQSLIQNNESSRVRDALSAAVAENSILRLRREERPPYPVPYPFPYRDRDRSRSPPRR